jgi:hypothetical protein
MAFNPEEYLIKLQGKDYLEVKWRILWFRKENPKGSIDTELLHIEPGRAVVKASVSKDGIGIVATGLAVADSTAKKSMWTGKEVMKAETAAIGRALAHAGYGTQFTGEDEGDFLSDSPVETKSPQKKQQPQQWTPETKMAFMAGLSKRFPSSTPALASKDLKFKVLEDLGTPEEARAKLTKWMYDNCQPVQCESYRYVTDDDGEELFVVFRANSNHEDTQHIAIRGYGRSTTIKDWIGDYAYELLEFDTLPNTPNSWEQIPCPITIYYEFGKRGDYYTTTGIGHSIVDPQVLADQQEEF